MKYACITRHLGEVKNVRLMCRVLDVAPSGYYAWRKRSPSLHAIADERLLLNVRNAYEASGGRYGAPRVHRELRDEGIHIGCKRVARLMRIDGLVGRQPRVRGPRTTDSNHAYPLAPNLLERRFDVNGIAMNRVWVSDITYVPTREGWLYLAVVLDLASRRVVGWAMRETLEAELALSALQMALAARRPAPGLIHHSDQGIQYACTAYRACLAAHKLKASMSRRGDCWDNAVAESFFATLEAELLAHHDWPTRAVARQAIFEFIESWYNQRRRHSTLDYVSPAAYEKLLAV
jgi:transposase InsO family protein